MKNLNKRSKIVLGIAGIIVVLGIAVIGFGQVSGAQLFGTVSASISPASATIYVGQSKQFTLNPAANCTWVVGSPIIAIAGSPTGSSVTVVGLRTGTTYVETTSNCAAGKARAYISVQFQPTPTPSPTPVPLAITVGPDTGKSVPVIGYGEYLTLCASDSTIRPENWTVLSPYPSADAISMVGSMTPGCIMALGNYHGTASAHAIFKATNAQGRQGSVEVYEADALSITPAYPVMNVGQSITMSMTGAEGSSLWSIYKGCENLAPADCSVRLSATSGHSVTLTAQKAGTVLITCKRFSAAGWGDTGLTQVIVH